MTTFRPAAPEEAALLAVLADMATRRLVSHLWGLAAGPGQSGLAYGRSLIRDNAAHFFHHRNWRLAEAEGGILGGFNAYVPPPDAAEAPGPAVVRPLNALKGVAAGSFYIAAAAILPEHQGRGHGTALLTEATRLAAAQGHRRVTLMVGSFNTGARRLYARLGFSEWARRDFIPFEGSDPEGQWLLLRRDLEG